MDSLVQNCTSKLASHGDSEDPEIKHKIPHRFRRTKRLQVQWCCHCGKLLPFRAGQCFECIECKVGVHDECVQFLPELCSLPRALALQMKEMQLKGNQKKNSEITQMTIHSPGSHLDSRRATSAMNLANLDIGKQRKHSLPDLFIDKFGSSSSLMIKGKKTRDESLKYFKAGAKSVGLDDFTFLAVLGKGNFGKVMLAQEKHTNKYYAIKVIKKEFILEHDEVQR
jgi:classical protein kinase C/novel protein kinase C epsilon type